MLNLDLMEIFSDPNRFSQKAMPFTSEIYERIKPDNDSDDYRSIGDDGLYDRFYKSLSNDQQSMFSDLETDYLIRKVCVAEREGFNSGVYLGFHLAMELLKGGDLYGVVKRNRD